MTAKIAIINNGSDQAMLAQADLEALYETVAESDAEIIVALGGDGFMLQTLHQTENGRAPIFGMNRGTVGFLMNEYKSDGLPERLEQAQLLTLHPLRMRAESSDGTSHEALAINEVSLLRETRQAAKIRIHVDGKVRLEELICDGVLAATPAGSTAYNLSAHGPILPLGSELMALTPISAFRPRSWRGAILPLGASLRFEILESKKRSVSVTADQTEVRDVINVYVEEDRSVNLKLLFDPEHNLADRILMEQFVAS